MEWHFSDACEYISSDDFFRTLSPKPAQVTESHARPWSPKPGSSQDLTFLRALKVKAKWLDGSNPTSICYRGITTTTSRS